MIDIIHVFVFPDDDGAPWLEIERDANNEVDLYCLAEKEGILQILSAKESI